MRSIGGHVRRRLRDRHSEVRPAASPDELAEAIELAARTFPALHERTGRGADYYASRRDDEGDLHVIAVVEGRVIGLALGSLSPDGTVITVGEVAVDAVYRHQGVGRALLAELEARAIARGIRHLSLGADEDVSAFYFSCGWSAWIQLTISGAERRSILERLRVGLLRGRQVRGVQEYGDGAMRVTVAVDGYDAALAQRLSAIEGCSAFVMLSKTLSP